MTSMPASRSARAIIFAPRSWPSSPGLAINTLIFFSGILLCDLCELCVERPFATLFGHHEPADSIFQDWYIEVDQQPDRAPGKPQVRQNDGFVDWAEAIYGFEFNDDLTFNQ